jgi:hypothetical protein
MRNKYASNRKNEPKLSFNQLEVLFVLYVVILNLEF